MSRGYPTRPPPPPDAGLGPLVPEGVCAICKRRPAETDAEFCAECARQIGSPERP